MMPGDVYFFKDFKFADGGKSDKLIILLNEPKDNEPYLFCLTTSKQHNRKTILGCKAEHNYFFVSNKQDNFDKDTWIVFDRIYEFTTDNLISACIDGAHSIFNLELTLWNAIKKCVLKSEDIPEYLLELIKN